MRRLVVLLVGLAMMATPVAAAADTFCVKPEATCPADHTKDTIQDAINAANGGAKDTVRLGATTYDGAQGAVTGNPVAIVGHGTDQTILRDTSSGSNETILNLDDPASSVSGVGFDLGSGPMRTGLDLTGTGSDIEVTAGSGAGASQTGVLLRSGSTLDGATVALAGKAAKGADIRDATLRHVTITAPTSRYADGQGLGAAVAGTGLLEDASVTAYSGVTLATGATARRVSILATNQGVGGSGTLESSDVHMSGASHALMTGTGSLTARHVTVLGDGTPGSIGAWVDNNQLVTSTTTMTLRSTIVRGFDTSLRRVSPGSCGMGCHQYANLDVDYSDYEFAKVYQSGEGTFTPATGHAHNVDLEPGFVNASSDHHLLASSPLIDAGEPGVQSGESTTDLSSLSRAVDGNGDASVATDMGAFEYQRRAPVVIAGGAPPAAGIGSPFTFSATATDPDPGDVVTFAWSADDGATGAGSPFTHAFATPGGHGATVTATDSAGVKGTATAGVTVNPPQPVISAAALRNRQFAVAAAATPVNAKSNAKKTLRGTTLLYSVNTASTTTIAIDRILPGRRKGTKCVAPTKSLRHAKKCTLYKAAGTLTRGAAAGPNSVKFSGRIGKKALAAGSYRMKLVATVAGLRSKEVTLPFKIVRG